MPRATGASRPRPAVATPRRCPLAPHVRARSGRVGGHAFEGEAGLLFEGRQRGPEEDQDLRGRVERELLYARRARSRATEAVRPAATLARSATGSSIAVSIPAPACTASPPPH
jgi:hypothetical protein